MSSTSQNNAPLTKQWHQVRHTWLQASTFLAAVKSRGLTETVLDVTGVDKTAGERVDEATFNVRKLSCFGDGNTQAACVALRQDLDGKFFCGACGCKANKLAVLLADNPAEYSKLHYPNLQCPLRKPGFSNAAPNA